jgi:hypothetical protein
MAALNIGVDGGSGPMSRSAAVNTARTPGALRASSTSIEVMAAWASVDRT